MYPLFLSLALAQPADPADVECRPLARGDGYLVHAVPSGARTPGMGTAGPTGGLETLGGPRYAILHTDTKSGRMKKLVAGGEWSAPLPPMAVNRAVDHTVSIAAVATGPERLYVLVMRSQALVEFIGPGGGRRREPTLQHVLFVFRLADGSTLQEVVLPEPRERLAGFNQDTLDPELIRVTPTAVRVGAAEYRIGDRLELVEPKP